MCSEVLQVPSCLQLLQTQVENVSDDVYQADVEFRDSQSNDIILHLAAEHWAMLHYLAAYLLAHCHLQLQTHDRYQ